MKLPVAQITVVMGRVMFPALSQLRDDRPRLGRAWLRALSVSGVAATPLSIGMAVAAPAMVEVLFGRRWTTRWIAGQRPRGVVTLKTA